MSGMSCQLATLLRGFVAVPEASDVLVCGLALDSRKLNAGELFFALPGTQAHGLSYLDQVLARQSAAVLWSAGDAAMSAACQQRLTDAGVVSVAVPELAQRVGEIAARFYGEPSQALHLVGVTGTDGKSSVAHLLAQALDLSGRACGLIGTLGNGRLGQLQDSGMTTPDALSLQSWFADFRAAGLEHVAMEVSSHALQQARVAGSRFQVAVLTNLGRDHFDYHGDLAAYRAAKARLFSHPGLSAAVLNLDDAFGRELRQQLQLPVLGYGRLPTARAEGADLWAEAVSSRPEGLSFRLHDAQQSALIETALVGEFNVSNLLAVACALRALGWDFAELVRYLPRLQPVPGRMETLAVQPVRVLIDYAHTPQALSHALAALRPMTAGQLWCVFGCGGDRDRGKRPLMAQAVVQAADRAVLTDDNPRFEAPEAIVRDALAGLDHPQAIHVEHDRRLAIAYAVQQAQPGDVVLVAGKGHENYQIRQGQTLHFSDRDVVRELCGVAA